jgi:hypothetical protein
MVHWPLLPRCSCNINLVLVSQESGQPVRAAPSNETPRGVSKLLDQRATAMETIGDFVSDISETLRNIGDLDCGSSFAARNCRSSSG